jgi:tRNA threonylcarbamoyladenosine biosynthesis protein TsaB
MIVLGMDTATPATAVGLRLCDGRVLVARDDPARGARPGHTAQLLALAARLLAEAKLGWSAIDRVAVGVGPGTFTGLRVGVATARGLAQASSSALVGVGSLRALAHGAHERASLVVAVIDARRGEVFAAAYARERAGAPARELAAARALRPGELAAFVARVGGDAHDAGQPPLVVGDGAVRYRDELSAEAITVPADDSPLHRVDGRAVCALGALGRATRALERVRPDYCRRPDAEIARERASAEEVAPA